MISLSFVSVSVCLCYSLCMFSSLSTCPPLPSLSPRLSPVPDPVVLLYIPFCFNLINTEILQLFKVGLTGNESYFWQVNVITCISERTILSKHF